MQAFLDARAKVIQPPRLPAVANDESQESQDYFAEYEDEFDYNDPDLFAILDSGNAADHYAYGNRQSDAAVAQVSIKLKHLTIIDHQLCRLWTPI